MRDSDEGILNRSWSCVLIVLCRNFLQDAKGCTGGAYYSVRVSKEISVLTVACIVKCR